MTKAYEAVGLPSWSDHKVLARKAMANSVTRPKRIVEDGAGGWRSEPIVPEAEMSQGIDPATMSPIPSKAQAERAERLARELAEADQQRAAERQAEPKPEPATLASWFGS